MRDLSNRPLVETIKERCRICYTCVRECPAKAIRIYDGQAEVIPERCIGCGNCVKVCSQKAKKVLDSKQNVLGLLKGPDKVAAIVAPSFPAEFTKVSWNRFVGMLGGLGFDYINEVGFGADIVAKEFAELLKADDKSRYIATSCPAIVAYIERYHPGLVNNLAKIVSPMVAMARVVKKLYGDKTRIVFVGPCIAKKGEACSVNLPGEVDESLTFVELRELFAQEGISGETVADRDFDEPVAGVGAIFPVSRGLFQAAEISEDLIKGEIIAVEGSDSFVEVLKEFENGDLDVRLLEILACDGCIMGPGISSSEPLFGRRAKVSGYVKQKMRDFDFDKWKKQVAFFAELDFSREFSSFDQRIETPQQQDLERILNRMGKFSPEDELNCGACGYNTCREHAIAILKGLAESEMCLPYTIETLHKTINELASSNNKLASTQEALMQSEKLASMGQLAAGIAHEVNNPLGVVLMYSHLLLEQYEDNPELKEELGLIVAQAERCKKIVGGLLGFARRSKVLLEPTDICELVENSIRTLPKGESAEIAVNNSMDNKTAEVDKDQMGQVLTNLLVNALAATEHYGKISVNLYDDAYNIYLEVADTGTGIAEENLPKIFEPFFTTKPIGKGTGLGLAVTYGIVKMHRGDIKVESNADGDSGPTGTKFTVSLPRHSSEEFKTI